MSCTMSAILTIPSSLTSSVSSRRSHCSAASPSPLAVSVSRWRMWLSGTNPSPSTSNTDRDSDSCDKAECQANHTADWHSTPHLVCGGLVLSSADSDHLLKLFEGQPLSAEFLGQVGNLNITDESMTEVQCQCAVCV